MINTIVKSGVMYITLTFLLSIAGNSAMAETLNPEGTNPHANAPRKRITLEQKQAAAAAQKKKKAEIAARNKTKKTDTGSSNKHETVSQPYAPESLNK